MFRSVGYRPVGLRSCGSRLQHRGAADRSELGDALGGPDRLVDVVGPREQALDEEARRGPDRLGGGLERYSAQNRFRVTDTPPSRSRL